MSSISGSGADASSRSTSSSKSDTSSSKSKTPSRTTSDTTSTSAGSEIELYYVFKEWTKSLPLTIPPVNEQNAPFVKPFFYSSHYKPIENQTARRTLDTNLMVCGDITVNPLYIHSKEIRQDYRHECARCTNDLWFVNSPRTNDFFWTRSMVSYKTKIEEIMRQWAPKEYIYAKEVDSISTESQCQEVVNIFMRQYQETRLQRLAQVGRQYFEELFARSQRFPDTSTRYLAWKNNSCTYDAVISIIPHLLVQMEICDVYGNAEDSEPSVTSTSSLAILGCLHFCSNAPDASTQVFYSNSTRDCAVDLKKWTTGRTMEEDALWSSEGVQNFLDIGDVANRVLFPYIQPQDNNLGLHTYEMLIAALPSKEEMKEASLAQYLLDVTKQNSCPSVSIIHLPKFKNKTARNNASAILCREWTAKLNNISGHVFGFLGSPSRNPEHFISSICGEHPDLYINDAMRNNGKFVKVDGTKILHGRQHRRLSLTIDGLRIIFLRW